MIMSIARASNTLGLSHLELRISQPDPLNLCKSVYLHPSTVFAIGGPGCWMFSVSTENITIYEQPPRMQSPGLETVERATTHASKETVMVPREPKIPASQRVSAQVSTAVDVFSGFPEMPGHPFDGSRCRAQSENSCSPLISHPKETGIESPSPPRRQPWLFVYLPGSYTWDMVFDQCHETLLRSQSHSNTDASWACRLFRSFQTTYVEG